MVSSVLPCRIPSASAQFLIPSAFLVRSRASPLPTSLSSQDGSSSPDSLPSLSIRGLTLQGVYPSIWVRGDGAHGVRETLYPVASVGAAGTGVDGNGRRRTGHDGKPCC